MGKRYAEAGGGIHALVRGVAALDHKRMLDMHAQRLCQDHRAQQIAAGFRPASDGIDCPPKEDDGMGDQLSVTGDQYHYYTSPTVTQNNRSGLAKYWPLLLGPVLGGAIAIGILLLRQPDEPVDDAPPISDTATGVTIE